MARNGNILNGGSSAISWFNLAFVAIILTAFFFAYSALKKFFVGDDVETFDIPINTMFPKPTISALQAKTYANSLHRAMRYPIDDEETITNIFQKLNVNDALLVYNKFGVRKITQGFTIPAPELPLNEWIKDQISSEEMAYMNAKIKLTPSGLW